MIFLPTQTPVPLTDIESVVDKYRHKISQSIQNSIGWEVVLKHLVDNFGIDKEQTKNTLLASLPSPMVQQIPGIPKPRPGLVCPDCHRPLSAKNRGIKSSLSSGHQSLRSHWKNTSCKEQEDLESITAVYYTPLFAYDMLRAPNYRLIFSDSYRSCQAPDASKADKKPIIRKTEQKPKVEGAPGVTPDFIPDVISTYLKQWKLLENDPVREEVRNTILALLSTRIPHKHDENSKDFEARLDLTLSRIVDLCLRFMKGATAFIHTGPVELLGLLLSK